jgi:hypothetical protein
LLIAGFSILLLILWGAFLGSLMVEISVIGVLFSVLEVTGWRFILFGFLGLFGLYYELAIIDDNLRIIETANGTEKTPFAHRAAIGGSLGIVILGLVLSLLAFLLRSEDSVLNLAYYMISIGTGFLLFIILMLGGAVFARVRRRR